MKLPPDTPLAELDWPPRPRLAALNRLGLGTLADLIRHYPRRHEDRRRFDRFPDDEMDRPVCLLGLVTKAALKRIGGWKRMFEITIEDESAGVLGQPVSCRWFNMPYVQKMISTGQSVVVYGRPKKRGRQIVIDHPEFEVVEEEETSIHLGRITPVHPAGDGVSPRLLRTLIHRALDETDLAAMPSLTRHPPEALRTIHFPDSFEHYEEARRQLVREEFFGLQLVLQSRRARWKQQTGAPKISAGALLGRLVSGLPFPLTASQTVVLAEIRRDLESAAPMNRLLQGDVGSGKTIVALGAMLLAAEAGWQSALMAPTQILADQHFLNFRRLLEPLGVRVALRTGDRAEDSGNGPLFDRLGGDAPHILVGTHALLHEGAQFEKLGLVVIDEQHKFGVLQRTRLIERATAPGAPPPDVLVLTATPIPRTFTQTLYGDLDVSILSEKPAGRGEVRTFVRNTGKLPEVAGFVRQQLDKGRQAYIVYPLVEESAKLAAKAATAEVEKWRPLLAPHQVGLLHGRMTADEKDAVMAQLRAGTLSALVATTVIEVGVDVPNATLMVVENAERFGLAQLHQLRGRIGRGGHRSYCILLHPPEVEAPALEKLAVIEGTIDGFAIAEADLRLRGPGDLLGTAQTGLPPLRLGDLFRDEDLMKEARSLAQDALSADPTLESPTHRGFREYLERTRSSAGAVAG